MGVLRTTRPHRFANYSVTPRRFARDLEFAGEAGPKTGIDATRPFTVKSAMLFCTGRILPALIWAATAISLGGGCRTDDVASSQPVDTQEALLPPIWEKPRIRVEWRDDPPVPLVVRLYEVRHDALDRRRVPSDAKSVLDGAPGPDDDSFTFAREIFQRDHIRVLAPGDAFLAELETWCRDPSGAAELVETFRADKREHIDFEWDIPTDAMPAVVGLSLSAARLKDGQVRMYIRLTPVSRPPVNPANHIPGLDLGGNSNQFDITADKSVAVGGLTIRRPIVPKKEFRGLRLTTISEETVELVAIISVVPPAAEP
jgi:hypothetical protein